MPNTYLSRTQSSSSRQISTLSCWVKKSRASGGDSMNIFSAFSDGSFRTEVLLQSAGDFRLLNVSTSVNLQTSALFRDVGAWYHFMIAIDTTQATDTNRVKMYVNGTQITSFSSATYPSQNSNFMFNNSLPLHIGRTGAYGNEYFDGLMANYYWIDGQALTPSSFGETDATTGIWKPKAYTGSYGTNGFFLKFENSGSLGTDSSGNGNNFTVNGTPTQTVDTPSNVFCTLNPLANTGVTLSNGNLTTTYSTNDANVRSTFGVPSGKWYWEAKVLGTASGLLYGICLDTAKQQINIADDGTVGIYGLQNAGTAYAYADTNGSRAQSAGFPNFVANNILQFALDRDNNRFYIGINGTYYNLSGSTGNPATGSNPTWTLDSSYAGRTFMFILETRSSSENTNVNFGTGFFGTTAISSPYSDGAGLGKFQYQPPTGYYSLCTKNINVYG